MSDQLGVPSGATAPVSAPPSGSRIEVIAIAALGGALFLDAAIETVIAGAPARWWVAGAAALFALATAATWRTGAGWRVRASFALLGLAAVVAATAWAPEGLTNGVRLFGQTTPRVMNALVATGVAVSGLVLLRLGRLLLPARIGIGLIAAYAVAAFSIGAVAGTPLPAMLGGQSLWQKLPSVLQGAFLGGFLVLPVGLISSIVRAGLRRPAASTLRAELWKTTAILASLATVLAGIPIGPSRTAAPPERETLASQLGIDPNAPKSSPAQLDAAFANSVRAIEDGERDSPRDRWDPAYVAAALGSDPGRIFTWVQNATLWAPYRGLLRGPVGVLMDRFGSSLDRAVLLATLLRQAHKTVRLAHGSLSRDQAAVLLRSSEFARYQIGPPGARPVSGVLAKIAADYHLDETSTRRTLAAQADSRAGKLAALRDRVPDEARRLGAAVGSSARPAPDAIGHALDLIQDHWWVQAQDGDGTWQDFDPCASAASVPLTSANETVQLDAVPAGLRHEVAIRVIAEQWAAGRLVERTALEHTIQPAEVMGTPIVLRIGPPKVPKKLVAANMNPGKALRSLALDQHEWIPALTIGTRQVAQSAILDTGDLKPAGEPASALGGAFSRFATSLDEALGEKKPAAPEPRPDGSKTLTAAWIEYEIRTPGERPEKRRRTIFDLIGPAARGSRSTAAPALDEAARLTRGLALIRETEMLPMACRFAPEFVTHLAAQSVLANREILSGLMRGEGPEDFAHAEQLARKMTSWPTSLFGLSLARFEWSRFGSQIHIERTNLLTRHSFFAPSSSGLSLYSATDIVANDIGVDPFIPNAFAIRLEQGVLDTNAEATLVSNRPNASNAGWAYAKPGKWTAVQSPGDSRLASLAVSDDVRSRIEEDLRAGYSVVAPSAQVTVGSETFSGWWRVHPVTGQTLGMGGRGWGQEMVEYLVTLAAGGFWLAFMFEYFRCQMFRFNEKEAPIARACDPSSRNRSVALLDLIATPVQAAGVPCLGEALFAGLIGALLAGVGGWAGGKPGGSRGGGGSDVDPIGDTEPGLPPEGPPPGGGAPPGGGTPPGGGEPPPGWGPPPGAGGPPSGGGRGPLPWGSNDGVPLPPEWAPSPGPKLDPSKLPPDVQKELEAWKAWKDATGLDKGAKFNEWINALRDSLKAGNPNHPYFKDPIPHGDGPMGGPGWTPGGSGGANPPTGPGGTQIMPKPEVSPTSPTQPGACPTCPTLPGAKTQTGLGGVLNAFGQKSGG